MIFCKADYSALKKLWLSPAYLAELKNKTKTNPPTIAIVYGTEV